MKEYNMFREEFIGTTNNTIVQEPQVSGEFIFSIFKGLPPTMEDFCIGLLHKHRIIGVKEGKWYSLANFLKALNEVDAVFGSSILFEIGKELLGTAIVPPKVKKLKNALNLYAHAYSLNHKESACDLKIVEYKKLKRRIIVEISNQYPIEMNRGLLTSLARLYSPKRNVLPEVTVLGSNSKTGEYLITW